MLPELMEIKRSRKALHLTQARLAQLSGVSQSFVAKIESGRMDPAYGLARKIFGVLEKSEKGGERAARDVMRTRILSVKSNEKLSVAISLMQRNEVSQLIVLDNHHHIIGSITEKGILERMEEDINFNPRSIRVESALEDAFPTLGENTPLSSITHILRHSVAVVVMAGNKPSGIITKSDLLGSA
ncbi:MAG TPA: CBS domain-containing protein [Candidatus Norongarragalinales archaeon]|nr:CBS domain-containing protein [Candidatus Norongarragalinales archaeon]